MGCKIRLFLQPIQVFNVLNFTSVEFAHALYFESEPTTAWQKESTRLNSSARKKPSIKNPSIRLSHIITIIALMTSRKSPSVTIVTGKVKNTSIGFTKMLSNPRTTATNKADINPATLTPGITWASTITNRVVKKIFISVFIRKIFCAKIKKALQGSSAFNVYLIEVSLTEALLSQDSPKDSLTEGWRCSAG